MTDFVTEEVKDFRYHSFKRYLDGKLSPVEKKLFCLLLLQIIEDEVKQSV